MPDSGRIIYHLRILALIGATSRPVPRRTNPRIGAEMRILRAFVGAVGGVIILVLALSLHAPVATAQTECMRMPYFTPFGYANFDFPPRIVGLLNDNEIAVEGITPFQAKPAKTGLYLPIGSHTNHIDACMGVYYPGGPKFVSKTGNSVAAENIWLRMDGAYA